MNDLNDTLQSQLPSQLPVQLPEKLNELRDIHLPDPVSIWPLAPGWWALIVLVPILYFVIRYIVKQIMMPKYKKLALQVLSNIETEFLISNNAHETCGEISLLIRTALVAKLGNQAVAGLVTEEWLDYLDELSKTDCFTKGAGRHLVTAPYAKESDVNIEELLSATKKLLRRL